MSESSQDPYYAHGWVEVLHRTDEQPDIKTLSELQPEQYVQVGSNLPLQEYYSPIDIYHQFKEEVDPDFGIPRSLRAYDVLNLCSDELNRIVTLVLVPQTRMVDLSWAGAHVQKGPDSPLVLISRPNIFESFYLNRQQK